MDELRESHSSTDLSEAEIVWLCSGVAMMTPSARVILLYKNRNWKLSSHFSSWLNIGTSSISRTSNSNLNLKLRRINSRVCGYMIDRSLILQVQQISFFRSPILQIFPVKFFCIFAKQFLRIAQFLSNLHKDTEVIKDGIQFLDDVKVNKSPLGLNA